ncbi:MAG: hypothetical protein ABIJ56_11705 [Pseudomonadota bacterium]
MNKRFMVLIAFIVCLPCVQACSDECTCPDAGCPSDDAAVEAEAGEDAQEDIAAEAFAPDLSGCEETEPAAASPDIYAAILERLVTSVPVNEGDWGEDFGDATAYSPPALLQAGRSLCDASYMRLADETLQHTHFLIDHFLEIMEGDSPDELIIGILGPIESYSITPFEGWADDADEGLFWLDETLDLFGDYLYAPSLDTSPYGPTAVTAIVAAENFRYVLLVDPEDSEKTTRGLEMAAAIDTYAWDPDNEFYKVSPDEEFLDLYPNVAMMIVWTLAHALTGEAEHLARAEHQFDAIAPLKLEDIGGYHSLYSSSVPDYVSFSSQNYLIFALYLLYLETEDEKYRDEALSVLKFIEDYLYSGGMVWHHWENEMRANWYCSGCNFQFLYVLNRLSEII